MTFKIKSKLQQFQCNDNEEILNYEELNKKLTGVFSELLDLKRATGIQQTISGHDSLHLYVFVTQLQQLWSEDNFNQLHLLFFISNLRAWKRYQQ